MKRILSGVAILVLAASLLPVKSQAGIRGAYDFITNGDPLIKAKFSPTFRGAPTTGSGTASSPRLERWLAFVTLSQVFGFESTGEIWLQRNIDQAFGRGFDPVALEVDPTAAVSYIDPTWSKDGKWLAYVQTDNTVSSTSIYVQQFDNAAATDGGTKLGSPTLIADGTGGLHHRHPAWNSAGTQIAYDSDAFGPSIDLWTVNVSLNPTLHTVTVDESSRTRHQIGLDGDPGSVAILNSKAEFKPAYKPDGTRIAFVTNRFGPFQILILTQTSTGLGESTVGLESNPAVITHDNPSWSSDGQSIYYDAASSEDPKNPQDIWKLDLATGQKCGMTVDLAGDVDPDVSQYSNPTREGIQFNYFTFISQAAGFGVQVWRGEFVQNCVPPLFMAANVSPSKIDLDKPVAGDSLITVDMTFPPQTIAAGYVCRAANQPNASGRPEPTKEGIRIRRSIIVSPTMLGAPMKSTKTELGVDCTDMDMLALVGEPIPCFDPEPDPDLCFGVNCFFGNIGDFKVDVDTINGVNHHLFGRWTRRTIAARIVALNLVNQTVPLQIRAYSNRVGRQFLGFGYIKLSKKNLAGSTVAMEQNYPNPFNPVTKFSFAIDKPGNASVRVFNTRGELVRTIVNQWYPQGQHEVSWDGKTASGGRAPSGIYFIKTASNGGEDVIKAVLAK